MTDGVRLDGKVRGGREVCSMSNGVMEEPGAEYGAENLELELK